MKLSNRAANALTIPSLVRGLTLDFFSNNQMRLFCNDLYCNWQNGLLIVMEKFKEFPNKAFFPFSKENAKLGKPVLF